MNHNHPIDAVISWVDGYDPLYQKKLTAYCTAQNIVRNKVIEPTRFQQQGEIEYCIRALFHYAPWIRTVYLITDDQQPPFLESWRQKPEYQRIQIISQNSLFSGHEHHLPVFNSLTIEWVLHRIPGLSSHFLYLNDDFFLTRPVQPSDFFLQGNPVLQGDWKTLTLKKWRHMWNPQQAFLNLSKQNPHRYWYEQSAMYAGLTKQFYFLHHTPYPLLKSTYETVVNQNPELFEDNLRFPFRHPQQMAPVPLMSHLDIQAARAHLNTQRTSITIHAGCHTFDTIRSRLRQVQKNHHIKFLCIQSLDQGLPHIQQYLIQWLQEQLIPSFIYR